MGIERFENWNLFEKQGSEPETLRTIKVVDRGDVHVTKMATEKIGDGEDPNMFFVSSTNDYMFHNKKLGHAVYYFNNPSDGPIKIEDHIIREIFGPFQTLEQAKAKAEDIELDAELGPRRISIDDRLNGPVYERVLKAEIKVIWQEEERGEE